MNGVLRAVSTHRRVIWALIMRELSTRYGRDNIGFLWLIFEPLVFAGSVTVMWSILKGKFEHGVPVTAFTVTGYMTIILSRHMINHGVNCVKANASLLYHRQITVLHLFVSRLTLEFISVTLAAMVIYGFMIAIGQMSAPKDLPMLYTGWFTLAWLSFGMSIVLGALGEIFEFIERIVQVITYIMLPLSASFYMVAWLPAKYRNLALLNPFVSTTEMVRGGYFGEFVRTYHAPVYAFACGAVMVFVGLTLLQFVRDHVEVE